MFFRLSRVIILSTSNKKSDSVDKGEQAQSAKSASPQSAALNEVNHQTDQQAHNKDNASVSKNHFNYLFPLDDYSIADT
jgi:hypothetical protein